MIKSYEEGIILVAVLMAVVAVLVLHIWITKRKKKRIENRLEELTKYLEQANIGSAGVLSQVEDEFSHLQDEIYKTVTSLYQTGEMAVDAKENFATNLANIAHQLKTPITSAFLSLQLMEKSCPNIYCEQIRKQLERLNSLEDSLLTLSKIDSGTLKMEREQIDVYTVLNLAAENLAELLSEKDITVSIPDKGQVEMCGDLEWTMEAIMNLMKNCMEHSESGGMIHCDYTTNSLYTEIKIWDEGSGFLEEDIPHLFERFYRGKTATGNGIGIGLALSKSIFELQNGIVTAQNLPDLGACFEIRMYSH